MRKHITLVGLLNVAWGGVGTLAALYFGLRLPGSATPTLFYVLAGSALLALTGILGGVGLLSGQSWARTTLLVVGVLNLLTIPVGTAVGIYTIWVLLKHETKQLLVSEAPLGDPLARDTSVNSKVSNRMEVLSGMALVTELLGAVGLYFLIYLPIQSQNASSIGDRATFWLNIHILGYSASYFLLFAGLCLAVTYRLWHASPRFPWVESATVGATVLAGLGFVTGTSAARLMWGLSFPGDKKTLFAMGFGLLLFGCLSPIAIWARIRLGDRDRRHALLAILLLIAIAFCAGSFRIERGRRSIHPPPYIFGLTGPG